MARRVLALIFLGLALIVCVVLSASESLTNRAGRTATAVTVTFTEQVRITSYDGTVFPTKEPSTRSETFRFSGGQLENGARFSVSWTPNTAEIISTEWETTGSTAAGSPAGTSTPLTYEQIMAQIAHYPGPDEPLYAPTEGEQIWLTDLEGHADIYDNDSIKINYAPDFDKSQITKVEVYRNGVKLRFVPALFDVLTNDQMKTFDGNLAENTPKSNHTDHAIFGYEYSLRFYGSTTGLATNVRVAAIKTPVVVSAPKRYAYLGWMWQCDMRAYSLRRDQIVAYLTKLRADGFTGVSVNVNYYMDTPTSSHVDVWPEPDPKGYFNQWTASDEDLRLLLACVRDAGLQAQVRCIISLRKSAQDQGLRDGTCWFWGCIEPSNLRAWFDSCGQIVADLARLAQEMGVTSFTPFTEMDTLERHPDMLRSFYTTLDPLFDGVFGFEESTNNYLHADYNGDTAFEVNAGQFWDWNDQVGRPLEIEWSGWTPTLETQRDQRLTVMVPAFVRFWTKALEYYRNRYPGSRITFGELGAWSVDGCCLGQAFYDIPSGARIRDDQEVADIWAASLIALTYMRLDGFVAWDMPLCGVHSLDVGQNWFSPSDVPYRVITSMLP